MPKKEPTQETPNFKEKEAHCQEVMFETFGNIASKQPKRKFSLFEKIEIKKNEVDDNRNKVGFKLPKVNIPESVFSQEDRYIAGILSGRRNSCNLDSLDKYKDKNDSEKNYKQPGSKIKILSHKLPSVFKLSGDQKYSGNFQK